MISKAIRLPLRLIPHGIHLPILYPPALWRTRWIAGVGRHGCWIGTYERNKRRLFQRALKPGAIVYDVGAYAGYYSLLAAVHVGVLGKVFAFEPVPENVTLLRKHLEINRVANVIVVECAASDRTGVASFALGTNPMRGHLSTTGQLMVRTISLDKFVSGGAPAPACIKIDVEGAEFPVLAGARSILEERRPILFVAAHNSESYAQCCQFLKGVGYEIRMASPPYGSEQELVALPRP